MVKHTQRTSQGSMRMTVIGLGIMSIMSSFALGIQTAGDIETIEPMSASNAPMSGDLNYDEVIDLQDVLIILEVAQGYEDATVDQLLADPDNDGKLTVDDAMSVIRDIHQRS